MGKNDFILRPVTFRRRVVVNFEESGWVFIICTGRCFQEQYI